ncbi:MAG TPA: sigma-70 family RNA polymerase sigma factor [Candidatus Methylomirabilis sp.]|nr:sigma-70 family RNA polymerase sigma factor [Candidatus Methylomirabilis sp.]
MDDGRLIQAMARGDLLALATFYDRYAPLVFGLAARVTGNAADAEEVLQDVFIQAWRQAARYSPTRAAPRTWLLIIARSRAIDRRRRRRHDETGGPTGPEAVDQGEDPGGDLEGRERREAVRKALKLLPPEQRAAIELAYFEGLTHTEIAALTGDPVGTVKGRLRLGMEKLRGLLGPVLEEGRQ